MLLKHISLFLVFLFLVLQGCQTQPVRHLAPEDLQTDVTVLASEDFRIWAHSPEEKPEEGHTHESPATKSK